MTVPPLELAWAAGLFEGEGTVRINKPTRRNLGALLVSVVNTDRAVVEFFYQRWPAYMKEATGLDPLRQKPAWVWVCAARRAADFLGAIRPYVVRPMMKLRIDHGLDFQLQKSMRSNVSRTTEYREAQWNAYWWMIELNKRGVTEPRSPLVDKMLEAVR